MQARSCLTGSRYRVPSILVLPIILLLPAAVCAQQLGLEILHTRAGYHHSLEHPSGFGGRLNIPLFHPRKVPVLEQADFLFSLSYQGEQRQVNRSTCVGLIRPGTDCREEIFNQNSDMTTFSGGIMLHFTPPSATWHPAVYLSGTMFAINAKLDSRESEVTIDPHPPEGISGGWAYGDEVTYRGTSLFHVSARIGRFHPKMNVCGNDAWFAFCKNRPMLQFSIGTQVQLSELVK